MGGLDGEAGGRCADGLCAKGSKRTLAERLGGRIRMVFWRIAVDMWLWQGAKWGWSVSTVSFQNQMPG